MSNGEHNQSGTVDAHAHSDINGDKITGPCRIMYFRRFAKRVSRYNR